MVSRPKLHTDPILRKLVSDRVALARQITGREKTIADYDTHLAGSLLTSDRDQTEQRKAHQARFLATDCVRLAQLDHTIAEMSQED